MRLFGEILEAAILVAIVLVIGLSGAKAFAETTDTAGKDAGTKAGTDAGTKTAFLDQISDKEMRGQGTSSASDLGVAGLISSSVVETSHNALCTLVTVVSPKDGSNRDLGLMSVSDLAAGALVEVPELVDEAGFTVGIVGLNVALQLTEASWFGARVLVSGKSFDDFVKKATAEKYKVLTQSVSCQSSARHETLSAVAKAILKAKKALHSM
jgi:hypothetical protein